MSSSKGSGHSDSSSSGEDLGTSIIPTTVPLDVSPEANMAFKNPDEPYSLKEHLAIAATRE